MIYTEMTKKALKFCYEAHKDQYDKSGVPYVFHSLHVAEQFDDEASICVALLHDVVEDTKYTIDDIAALGFTKEIIDAVDCITKRDGMEYMDYIKIVKTNSLATKVKLADIAHNSDVTRLDVVGEKAVKRLEKYRKAKAYLEE